ncbi:MAG: ABC transporter ATP-binding protein, partial [Lachnospiraceae bacterium]|nr:ABC transporter ATP-binding protein [Lachnospiraceae bacterium]
VFDIDEATRAERIQKYGDMFEITEALGDLISSYSHGMKQKVAIISALIHEPKLMVLDEPFVGLDPKASFTLKQIMHEMCERGAAVFFSTHVLDVAEKLCNKVAIIKQGKIIAAGTMEELTQGQSLEEVFLEVEDEK